MKNALAGREAPIIDVSKYNFHKMIGGIRMYAADLSQRPDLVRPIIVYRGRQLYVPVVADLGNKSKLVDFLNETVVYSQYSNFLPEMLKSIQ